METVTFIDSFTFAGVFAYVCFAVDNLMPKGEIISCAVKVFIAEFPYQSYTQTQVNKKIKGEPTRENEVKGKWCKGKKDWFTDKGRIYG